MNSNDKKLDIEKLYEMRQKDIQESINKSIKTKKLSSSNIKPIENLATLSNFNKNQEH